MTDLCVIRLVRYARMLGLPFLVELQNIGFLVYQNSLTESEQSIGSTEIWFTHPYEGMNHRATPARKRKDSFTTIGPHLPKGRKDPSENRTTPV